MALPIYLALKAPHQYFDKFLVGFVALSAAQVPLTYYQTGSFEAFERVERINHIFYAATVFLAFICFRKMEGDRIGTFNLAASFLIVYKFGQAAEQFLVNRKVARVNYEVGGAFNEDQANTYDMKWGSFPRIEPLKVAALTQAISFLTLGYLSSSPITALFGSLFSSINYFITAQVGAVNFKFTVSYRNHLSADYSLFFFRGLGKTDQDDHCLVFCGEMEESFPPCQKHSFHFHSIVRDTLRQLSNFYDNAMLLEKNGVKAIRLKANKLPKCPFCMALPHHSIEVRLNNTPLKVEIENF